jgi:hypothetical protein
MAWDIFDELWQVFKDSLIMLQLKYQYVHHVTSLVFSTPIVFNVFGFVKF